jgi:hypothetical protein
MSGEDEGTAWELIAAVALGILIFATAIDWVLS